MKIPTFLEKRWGMMLNLSNAPLNKLRSIEYMHFKMSALKFASMFPVTFLIAKICNPETTAIFMCILCQNISPMFLSNWKFLHSVLSQTVRRDAGSRRTRRKCVAAMEKHIRVHVSCNVQPRKTRN